MGAPMNTNLGLASGDESLEECVDDLDEAIGRLIRYDEAVLAFGLRVHLASLLHALLKHGRCTAQELKEFVAGLEADALGKERE